MRVANASWEVRHRSTDGDYQGTRHGHAVRDPYDEPLAELMLGQPPLGELGINQLVGIINVLVLPCAPFPGGLCLCFWSI